MDGRRLARIAIDTHLLHNLFAAADQGFCLCEVVADAAGRPIDYRFLAVNELFEQMTGLHDATGRTALELVPDLEPFWVETYGRVGLERRAERFRNQSVPLGRWFDVSAIPIEPHGHFAIVFRDITAEKRVEDEREANLRRAEALLQELNHRVMNSLGMIAAIIALEARGRGEGEDRQALERIGDRVRAIGDLYRTLSTARYETEVRVDDYLGTVVARLADALADAGGVRLTAAIAPTVLPTRWAAPLGLMVNELVMNSLKHAFKPGEPGRVTVTLRVEGGGMMRLTVADNGRGIGDDDVSGIGRSLVEAFARDLGGRVSTSGGASGTQVTVDFPVPVLET